MASNPRPVSAAGGREKTYFEQQREALIGDIAMVRPAWCWCCVAHVLILVQSFEHVLANINKLNRSLEAVTAVRLPFGRRAESCFTRGLATGWVVLISIGRQ